MSLESMSRRLAHHGGVINQNRMIDAKLDSFRAATTLSYQGAQMQIWGLQNQPIVRGLINRISQNENTDTKMVSTEYCNNFRVGTYFKWLNTNTHWIIYLQDKTELAYFRGECRPCNFSVEWIDKERRRLKTLISVIGPTVNQLRTSSSMQAAIAEDFPNANLIILVQNNPANKEFFTRYQTILIEGTAYQIEEVNDLSMPGIIRLSAIEYYSNLIEDNVEENVRNFWNVQPIIPEHTSEVYIDGPDVVNPFVDATFETPLRGGYWVIMENEGIPTNKRFTHAKFVGSTVHEPIITVHWDSIKSGLYTLGYKMPNGNVYQKAVYVEQLF